MENTNSMAQLFKKIIKTTSFLLILILSTGSVSAQKSKKKSTKSTATKTKTTTTSTTTSTKTTTKVEKKTLETKLSEEEQKNRIYLLEKNLLRLSSLIHKNLILYRELF